MTTYKIARIVYILKKTLDLLFFYVKCIDIFHEYFWKWGQKPRFFF